MTTTNYAPEPYTSSPTKLPGTDELPPNWRPTLRAAPIHVEAGQSQVFFLPPAIALSITIGMHLTGKRTHSQSPPFDLTFPSLAEEPATASTSSNKRLASFTTSLKRITTINSNRSLFSQPSTPPSTRSLSRCSSSSSSESISFLDLTQMTQVSF